MIVLIWRGMAGSSSIGSPQPQSHPPPLTQQPGVLAQLLALLLEQLSVDRYSYSFMLYAKAIPYSTIILYSCEYSVNIY